MALLLLGSGYFRPELLTGAQSLLSDHVARPLYTLTAFPSRMLHWFDETFTSRVQLEERNRALEHENFILQRNMQRMAALQADNARLKELLNSTENVDDSVLVSGLLSISPDPRRMEMVVNRGKADGVFEGQPVLDAHGLVGIVAAFSEHTARVLLITDTSNAVPVQVNRNGVHGIAEGSGRLDELYIRNLVPTTDIKQGDLIVSSGLGERYPPAYPVGEVTRIEYDGADSFLRVVVKPSAQLDRAQQLLLIFRSEAKISQPALPQPTATAPHAAQP
ncbi:MAG: rod shape-determining protein MreC [Pseudomonadales bacterium]